MFLARPGGKLSDLDRFPEHVNSSDICLECEEQDERVTLECEKVSWELYEGFKAQLTIISATNHIILAVSIHLSTKCQKDNGSAHSVLPTKRKKR